MLAFDGIAGLLMLFLWVFCILDCIATDQILIRNLPKTFWLIIVIFLPEIGSIAWLLLGRPQGAGFGGGTQRHVPPVERQARQQRHQLPGAPVKGPDDSPEFMKNMEQRRLQQWEDELRKREEELRKREGGDAE